MVCSALSFLAKDRYDPETDIGGLSTDQHVPQKMLAEPILGNQEQTGMRKPRALQQQGQFWVGTIDPFCED